MRAHERNAARPGSVAADADHQHSGRVPYEGGAGGEGGGAVADTDRPTLPDFIYSTYNSLLESGWRMDEIDRMDMPGFLRVRAWHARREQDKKKPRRRYIDEVWPGVKP